MKKPPQLNNTFIAEIESAEQFFKPLVSKSKNIIRFSPADDCGRCVISGSLFFALNSSISLPKSGSGEGCLAFIFGNTTFSKGGSSLVEDPAFFLPSNIFSASTKVTVFVSLSSSGSIGSLSKYGYSTFSAPTYSYVTTIEATGFLLVIICFASKNSITV